MLENLNNLHHSTVSFFRRKLNTSASMAASISRKNTFKMVGFEHLKQFLSVANKLTLRLFEAVATMQLLVFATIVLINRCKISYFIEAII